MAVYRFVSTSENVLVAHLLMVLMGFPTMTIIHNLGVMVYQYMHSIHFRNWKLSRDVCQNHAVIGVINV